jgi:uncharacterized BrkB/YihY/UPF0761 family membrane protein
MFFLLLLLLLLLLPLYLTVIADSLIQQIQLFLKEHPVVDSMVVKAFGTAIDGTDTVASSCQA